MKTNLLRMESGDSSSFGLGNKAKRNRRAWTPVEEGVLADLIKDLVARGWRSENGFTPGYLQKLETGMAEKLPGADIKADPHITSRITIWKKAHASLLTMLKDNFGIGFNSTTGMIDCHNEAWNLIVKADPNATNMRYKSWPLYEACNEIFGRDRANGGNSEDVMQAVNKLIAEDASEFGDHDRSKSVVDREEPAIEMEVNSEAFPNVVTIASRNLGKKRSATEALGSDDKLCNALGEMSKSQDARMDNLVRGLGIETNIGISRRELPGILDAVTDINEEC